MSSRLATLVLAAGAGSRFGGAKLLALVEGEPMLQRAARLAAALTPGAAFVVLGCERERLRVALPADVHAIYHAAWAEGLGSSLAAGIRALPTHIDGALVLLADQVALTAASLQPLLACWRLAPERVVCAQYGGGPGVPAIFPRRLFATLAALHGDRGAKPLLLAETDATTQLPLPEAAIDIDTPADLHAYRATSQS